MRSWLDISPTYQCFLLHVIILWVQDEDICVNLNHKKQQNIIYYRGSRQCVNFVFIYSVCSITPSVLLPQRLLTMLKTLSVLSEIILTLKTL